MKTSKITDIRLDKRKVYLTSEYGGTIDLPRREGRHLLSSIGCYDNGKWTAIDTYRKLIGYDLVINGSEVWIQRENKQKALSKKTIPKRIEPPVEVKPTQATTIDDKVLIIGSEILPPGEGEERGELYGSNPEQKPEIDTSKYIEAMRELGINAVKIYRRRESVDFLGDNKYEVYETPSGRFIAVSPKPKNAVYVAGNLETLLEDKQTIIKGKSAQRIWRQGAWRDRVRELA